MNKKGFTLVELLAVIVIISILLVIITPAISKVINQSRETVYNKQINTILNSAYDYSLKNINLLPEYNDVVYLTLSQLKKEAIIDSDIINPENNELFQNDLVISIKNVGVGYKSKSDLSIVKGSYLYKIEKEFMDSDTYINNKPIIYINESEDIPTLVNVDINSTYIPFKYSSKSKTGEDITNKVIEIITYNNKIVNDIDTKKAGIYHVSYTVVDLNGYSNTVDIGVAVNDTTPPVLKIKEDETISTDINSYNHMEGVTCTDNSGICDIDYTVTQNSQISNKYIIEYSAKDPSGNTVTEKRVLTIE